MVEEYFNETGSYGVLALLSGLLLIGGVLGLPYSLIWLEGWDKLWFALAATGSGVLAYFIAPVTEDETILTPEKKKIIQGFEAFPMHLINTDQLEYISVFYQINRQFGVSEYGTGTSSTEEAYYVKLWYPGNRHVNIYRTDNQLIAIGAGYHIAKKLQVDYLDATHGADQRWIDLDKSVEKYLEHLNE